MSSVHSNEDKRPAMPTLKKSISRNSILLTTKPSKDSKLIVENAVFPEQQAPPLTNGISASESTRSIKRKFKKANISSSFMNPTDIFAQNLSDAVMDAEDSDDLEVYVYRDKPKHNHWNNELDHHYYYPYYQHTHPQQPYYYYSSTDTDGCESSSAAYKEKLPSRRPVLRSTVSEIPTSIKDTNSARKIRPLYNTFYYNSHINQSGDEEYTLRHARRRKPTNNHTKRKNKWLSYLYVFLGILFTICFTWLIIVMCASPLNDVEVVGISNVLGTQKELIFNLHVRARNSNWWTITMTTAAFSVFASSHYVPTALDNNVTYLGADPAEFLGTIYHLEDPLIYQSGTLFNATVSVATSQIQIKNPGATKDDMSGNERWSLLIRYPYELTVRGVLKYQILPFIPSLSQLHSVRVCKMARVDPSTGQISDNIPIPEKSICDDPSPIEGSNA
ncbi:hypothetical protein RMATCC62417_02803 [Rhizopus microsporus]|nr:hypothetical protein RMATCC62417_02803 [Rhizopus microsporus]